MTDSRTLGQRVPKEGFINRRSHSRSRYQVNIPKADDNYNSVRDEFTGMLKNQIAKLSDELRTTEEALSKTSELMAATVDYAKTRPVFDGYKAARYSKKYLAQHEVELATYRAAKDTMNTILNGAKLPKIEALKKSRRELAGQKKELYAEYRDAQRQMREAVAIKANIDHLLSITDERENKAQER